MSGILLGIALENFEYPFPVYYLEFESDGRDVRMAFMDIEPSCSSNDRKVVLMHGKNFFGAYWEDTIRTLVGKGYRVVVPDQIGFGKSSKPDIHYSFHQMSYHTRKLLDTTGVDEVADSMGYFPVLGKRAAGALRFASKRTATTATSGILQMLNKLIGINP